jgi:hypothetical protein
MVFGRVGCPRPQMSGSTATLAVQNCFPHAEGLFIWGEPAPVPERVRDLGEITLLLLFSYIISFCVYMGTELVRLNEVPPRLCRDPR